MRTAVVVVVVVLLASVGCARPNPRIKSMVRKEGTSAQATAFTYDGAHPKTVAVDLGSGQSKTFALTFDGGKVTKMTVTNNVGDGEAVDDSAFAYDGDRLTKATTTIGQTDQTVTTTFEHDGDGRITKLARATEFGSGTNTDGSTFTYAEGALAKIVDEKTFAPNVGAPQTTTITKDVEYGDDGKLAKIKSETDAGATAQLTATYEDGLLPALAEDSDFGGVEITSTTKLTFKDGRVSRISTRSTDIGELEFDFEYEDGDVADIDVTPADLGFLGLWDLRGGAYNGFDARTQAVRLAGANW